MHTCLLSAIKRTDIGIAYANCHYVRSDKYYPHIGHGLKRCRYSIPCVTAVDDVVKSSAVCIGDFGREDGEGETELVSDLDASYQEGWN
jgi:hypothetical protein